MFMSELDVEATIRQHRDAVEGEACSRSRVMDALLDLRLDAADRPDLVVLIDDALADLPGKTLVPADWWRDRLDTFELAAINPVEPVG